MRLRPTVLGSRDWPLYVILLVAAGLMSWGIWLVEPTVMGPDEKSAVTKALWLGVNRTPFIPDFTKGGKFYIYFLAGTFAPLYMYLLATGRTEGLASQASQTSTFFDAPPALRQAFYDFVVMGRVVSVLLGVVTVYLTYVLGRRVYGRQRGLVAASFLAVGMAFVNTAHLATEDTLLTALLTLEFVLLAAYFRTEEDRYLWQASLVAGLAVSTKLTAGFLVFPLAYALFGKDKLHSTNGDWTAAVRGIRRLSKGGVIALSAYLVTTPAIFVYPGLYVTELLNESSAAFSPGQVALPGWIVYIFGMGRAFGLPLFLLVVVGLFLLGNRLIRRRANRFEKSIALFIVPYYVVIGSWQTGEIWYVVPLMPVFVLFAAESIAEINRRIGARGAGAVLVFALLFSTVYSGITVAQIATDARADSTEWLEERVSEGDEIDAYVYPLQLPAFPDRAEVNIFWFNTSADSSFETARYRVGCAKPEFIVLSSTHYGEFVQNPDYDPLSTAFYRELLDGRGDYEIAATFGPSQSPVDSLSRGVRLTVMPETITNHNVRIVVLERSEAPNASCPTET